MGITTRPQLAACVTLFCLLALVAPALAVINPRFTPTDLVRTSLYYDHYLFEALASLGRVDALFARLDPYFAFADRGLRTTLETIDPSRSDCHAWAAHPRYHAVASILGVRPASWGYTTVEITPQLGPLQHVDSVIPYPNCDIIAEYRDGL